MDTSLFDYDLPGARIAQTPMEPREQARLLVVHTESGSLEHRHVFDVPDFLTENDLLVFNDSKVFKARLRGTVDGKKAEVLLLRPVQDLPSPLLGKEGKRASPPYQGGVGGGLHWLALAKPGKNFRKGCSFLTNVGTSVNVVDKKDDGTVVLDFGMDTDDVFDLCDREGEVPLPPYVHVGAIHELPLREYQTVYARERGSVAAPTAGFHFTDALLKKLDEKGVKRAFVTLHVGVGTFRPIKTDTLEAHEMHEEWAHVPQETLDLVAETKKRGGRVVVVGTTAMRALESACHPRAGGDPSGWIPAFAGMTNLFITPGYHFQIADALITNFHLPKSTLLVLVSAFAGRELILKAYCEAIEKEYRFYSFGDAMLIVK